MTQKFSFMWPTHVLYWETFYKKMAGIPWPKLSSDLPPTFEASATPPSFLDCCQFYSTATPSPQYIVIVAYFFTHPLDERGYKVNINSDTAVPLPFCFGAVLAVFGPPSLSTMSLPFIFYCRAVQAVDQQVRPQWRPGIIPWDYLSWFHCCISPVASIETGRGLEPPRLLSTSPLSNCGRHFLPRLPSKGSSSYKSSHYMTGRGLEPSQKSAYKCGQGLSPAWGSLLKRFAVSSHFEMAWAAYL